MPRPSYDTDLTDDQWSILSRLMPPAKNGRTGRRRTYALREIWNAIFYQMRSGCAWRLLPHDFPPYGNVFFHFRRWHGNGTLAAVHDGLNVQVRANAGKDASPSAAIIDSQSVKTTQKGGPED
jgi:transposase